MTTARILELFDMELPEPDPSDPWFLDWVLRSPRQAGIHLTAGWHALLAVTDVYAPGDIITAREYFGGIGAQALMVEEIFAPADHLVGEYSQAAVNHILGAVPRGVWVVKADAYAAENTTPADLVVLDFGDLTAWKALRPDPRSDLLERVFMLEPKAVVFTDIASRYLHLHRERYETILGEGTCGSYPDYLRAFLAKIEERWGYTLVAGSSHSWSAVMTLVPSGLTRRGKVVPVPESPTGLVLLP